MRITRHLWFSVSAVLFVVGCQGWVGTKDETEIKCEGYPKTVCEKCGVDPIEVRLFQRMGHAKVSQLAIKQTSDCIKLKLHVKLKDSGEPGVDLDSCITSNKDLDPPTRDTLLQIVKDGSKRGDLKKSLDAWETCYRKAVGS